MRFVSLLGTSVDKKAVLQAKRTKFQLNIFEFSRSLADFESKAKSQQSFEKTQKISKTIQFIEN